MHGIERKYLHFSKLKEKIKMLMNFLFKIKLQPEVNINSEVVSGAHVKGNADFTVQATKVAHAEKAPQNVCSKQPIHNIMQPRK